MRRIIIPKLLQKTIAPWRRPIRRDSPVSYNSAVLADSPSLFWGLSDLAGVVATDLSGNGRDGVYAGAFALGQPGVVQDGTTALGGGTTAFADRAGLIGAGAASFTMEYAIRPTNVAAGQSTGMFGYRNAPFGGASGSIGFEGTGTYYLGSFFTSLSLPAGSIVNGVNYLIALTWDGVNGRFYKNGVLVDGPLPLASVGTTEWDFAGVGKSPGFSDLQGIIHKFAIYPTALSDARMAAHFSASGI